VWFLEKKSRRLLQAHKTRKDQGQLGWWTAIESLTSVSFPSGQILVLIQPSSAVIERFFSVVKANTSEKQGSEIDDTLGRDA
jgi:hypothetical protein